MAAALAGLAVLIYLWWEAAHRGIYQYATGRYPFDDADEWRYTACSSLVDHGYRLFDQVFSAQPPLFFASLAAGMRVFGDSMAGPRATEVAFGLLGLVAAGWVAWELAGPVAAGCAALVLTVSPGFLIYSHAVEAEGPMMALATLALALALTYRRSGPRLLLVASGLALAAATLMKLFALEALLPVLWLIATRERTLRPALAAAATFVCGLVPPLALDLTLISPRNQWQQVIGFHNTAATVALPNLLPPGTILARFLLFDLGLSIAAAAGLLALLLARRYEDLILLTLWVPGSLAMLFLFRPLFPHHAAILLTGLAVCAGVGVGVAATLDRSEWPAAAPVAVAALAYVLLLPRLVGADRYTLLPADRSAVVSLAAYVHDTTSRSDIVAADDLEVAVRAGRLVPAPLCDPSNVRLLAGYLTAHDLIRATESYHAALVVPSRGIYAQVPAYLAWVRTHYSAERAPGGVTVYRLGR